jgi:hypothetical protein
VLTPEERKIIIKRAFAEGQDPAEVNLLLDAEIQKINQQRAEQAKQQAPKVHKCPVCGEIMPALTGICPSCGNAVGTGTSPGVEQANSDDLNRLVSQMNSMLAQLKAGTSQSTLLISAIEEARRKALTLYGENPKVRALTEEVAQEVELYKKNEAKKKSQNTRKGCIGCLIALGVFCLLGLWGNFLNQEDEDKVEKQYKELKEKIEDMQNEPITIENYETKMKQLNRLDWENIPNVGEYTQDAPKKNFLKLKRRYAKELREFHRKHYKELGDENEEDEQINEIEEDISYEEDL